MLCAQEEGEGLGDCEALGEGEALREGEALGETLWPWLKAWSDEDRRTRRGSAARPWRLKFMWRWRYKGETR